MNIDYVEKNLVYQEQIEQIAKVLYYLFYYMDEENNPLPLWAAEINETENIRKLLPGADKIFQFFGDAESAKKAIRFLHTINPIKAKEIFDSL